MRAHCYRFVFSLLVLITVGVLLSLSGRCETDLRPIIVLRSDDIRSSWRTPFPEFGGMSALEYGKLKRIPITWGVITKDADSGVGLTWSEIKNYLDIAGGEAASHSVSHVAMSSTQAYIDEVVNSKAIIDARLGPTYTCRTFLQPGVWTGDANCDSFEKLDNAIGQAIQSTYAQSMAYLGTGWRVGGAHYYYGTTNLYSVDYSSSLSELNVRAMLDVAAATPGVIFIISCHGVQASNGTQSYLVPANIMAFLMNRLAELRDSGTIRLMSLNDAFNTPIPEDLNRIPNPAFEIYTEGYSDPCVPWYRLNATLLENQGRNASRCVRLSNWNSKVQTGWMLIEPGLYELTWYQKCDTGSPPNSALQLEGVNHGTPYATTVVRTAYYPKYRNNSYNTWEQKSALLLIKDKLLRAVVAFQPTGGVFLVDDVRLVKKSVDPNVCPSNISIVPNPTGGTIYWDTPNNASVRTINCRYGSDTHPISINDGISLGTVNAIPGSRQQLSFEINWQAPNLYGIYCSIFSTGDAWYSDPNVEYLIVDKTPPQVTANVNPLQGDSAIATWSVSEDKSSVYQVKYAVGSTYGSDDIINWTVANGNEVTLTNLPTNTQLFFSVKAQNAFGFWSQTYTVAFRCLLPLSISSALASPNGTYVTASGYVTAVFNGESYIEDALRVNAIKLIGSIAASEGEFVTVSGIITTVGGERAIILEGSH